MGNDGQFVQWMMKSMDDEVKNDSIYEENKSVHQHLYFSSVAHSCLTLCIPMDCSTAGLPVHHQHPKFTQTHVH